jgi:hypothetical protein
MSGLRCGLPTSSSPSAWAQSSVCGVNANGLGVLESTTSLALKRRVDVTSIPNNLALETHVHPHHRGWLLNVQFKAKCLVNAWSLL